ncbi:hypothetical protein IM511_02430 [Erythrobacteraceae bacterium E2-1 Yellow Sea]|nr:hypothetical protein [Erythrobacteraceae bacterium E2-1 Yellow Sea]
MAKKSQHRFFRDELGAVAATYALALVPLIAVTGLAFDYARVAGMETELQNAADQAALAGATQLTRTSGSMERAIAAIQGGLVANNTAFSNDGAGNTVAITNAAQIVFYSSKADAEAGTNSFTDTSRFADARFVEVTVDTREARYALTPIVGAIKGSLNAQAVAGVGSALCRIPPLMICNPYEPENPDVDAPEDAFDFNDAKGKGLLLKPGGGSQWTPGNYGYLDIGTNGAVGVREALGWNSPGGECVSQDGIDTEDPADVDATVDTQTGNIASGPQAINTRFDIYSTQGCINDGTCSPAYNSRKDLMRPVTPAPAAGNSCDIHADGWQESPNAYHPTTVAPVSDTTVIDSMGHPRDICHAVEDSNGSPIPGNCHDARLGDGIWDRDAYFRTYFGWAAYGAPGGWDAQLTGITMENTPGNDIQNISRYDVYKWEEKNDTRLADKLAAAPNTGLTTRNKPVCGAVQGTLGYSTAVHPFDRRRITVAVVNCNRHEVKGNSPNVPVVTWADVFLVQPSYARGQGGKFSKKDQIYGEIIGETDITRVGAPVGPTIRRDMPYLVK